MSVLNKQIIPVDQSTYQVACSVDTSNVSSSQIIVSPMQSSANVLMPRIHKDKTRSEKNTSQHFLQELINKHGYSLEKISEYCQISKRVLQNVLAGKTCNFHHAAFQRLLGFYCQVKEACLGEGK